MSNSTGIRGRSSIGLSVLLAVLILSGCATTGRGEFPPLPESNRSTKTLAILPPVGPDANRLNSSVLYHLNQPKLEKTFESVRVIADTPVRQILTGTDSLTGLSQPQINRLNRAVEADWLLVFFVHELRIERFTTRDTERLQRSETSYSNIDVDRSDTKTGETTVFSRKSEYEVAEIPVTEDNIRVVLSMSAELLDLNTGQVIWRGRRIERAEDELQDLSAVELEDIVVERIMYRIVSRLTG